MSDCIYWKIMCLKNWVLSYILHKMLNLVFKSAQNAYEPWSFVELILVVCQTYSQSPFTVSLSKMLLSRCIKYFH